MLTGFLLFYVLFYSGFCTQFFYTSPEQIINLGSVTATTMEIADDESMIVVGYSNGLVQSFTMQGVFLGNFTGFGISIYDIMWINGFGPMILYDNGDIKIYSSNGSEILKSQIQNLNIS